MEDFFKYVTPVIYWILVWIWLFIFIFYLKKLKDKWKQDKLLGLLLLILSIDAFRTLFESIFFGTWYTSLSGLIPIEIFDFLAQPQIVFFPKVINLIAASLVLMMIIKKWLPSEILHKNKINKLIEEQNSELIVKNKELIDSANTLRAVNKELELAKEIATENETALKTIINTIPDVIWLKDINGNYLRCNHRFEEFFGASESEIIGKTDYDFVPLELADSFRINDKVAMNADKPLINEEQIKFASDGHSEFLETIKTPVYNSNKEIVGVLGIGRNITERKIAEKELKESKEKAEESDGLKTEFINNMSHEIRTPMNGILGFSSFLNKPDLTADKKRLYINIIQNSGHQLLRIIDDILEISKLGTKQVKVIEKEVCLNDLLLEHFSIFDIKAKEQKIPLYLHQGLSNEMSTIITDDTKLNKVISNLLENALKFTVNGFIEFGYTQKDNTLEIYVKDTGIGIKENKQESIFLRFSQEEKDIARNAGGLGLGLSIAKENTELIGGKITLESEKGIGSTFFITIPYKPANPKIEMDSFTGTKSSQNLYTILLVEDEEVNHLYLEALLDEFGLNLKTLHAKNGKEAVEMCEKHEEIDLVLMDIKMPVMCGFEATKLIRAFRPEVPIVAQTAHSTSDDKKKTIAAGCNDFITKPISEESLRMIIFTYLRVNE